MLTHAVTAGVTSVGAGVTDLGIAPTPAVSTLLAMVAGPSFGVVISASHNPYEDNGIKLFSPDGRKLSVAEEEAIERRFRVDADLDATDGTVGSCGPDGALVSKYLDAVAGRFRFTLSRTRLVIDAAHGAFAPHVRPLFSRYCNSVDWLNCDFDGADINRECGSTHVESLDPHLGPCAIGLAFDGDGDRMLIRIPPPLEKWGPGGVTVDGDAFLYLFAKHLVTAGPVIGTVMSNGALDAALETLGRPFWRAPVGDREVFEMMQKEGSSLGGEQSGHIILKDQRTGDGAVTALAFLQVFAERYAESAEAMAKDLPAPFPQKLVNVRVAEKRPWEDDPALSAAVAGAREKLGKHGRLVIRYSGTEPLLRIMAESPSAVAVEEQVSMLTARFRDR